ECLIREGDQGDAMYLLVQGRLTVHNEGSDKHAIREIGVGEAVGELAILTDMPRSATVFAIRDSTLLKITQETFRHWVTLHPDSAVEMISSSIKRLLPSAHIRHIPVMTLGIIPTETNIDTKA